ncbi:hypothetical protein T440DRAFT_320050 [Plenodomus tracheiphilus IPT5]|uniref:Uncharacterized protein n=1 Tax=Plenodomus tracheiphilus IPT5 TaxID=1408161 RepID=A0A6A7BEQ0_9PLEO|nr:hypothetical protein T440DRAFT_320050 [Plenodomus tracheiphilus IPT5]
MAPVSTLGAFGGLEKRFPEPVTTRTSPPTRGSLTPEGGFLEAWAQGYNVGSLIILILIVFCNYRSGIWLHKLILLELVLALWHGTFIFIEDPYYGWYLSTTATLLFISYFLHNVVSWLKIRPFLPRWGSRLFIISLLCVQPFWVAEAWSNFEYFNTLGSKVNVRMRPWEALVRDPWWIFTTWKLIDAIKKTYGFKFWTLMQINRRFGVMLLCMFLSIVFLLTDVVVSAAKVSASSGINPYWRFALVFKCASDTIFLDDFKSVLDDIMTRKFSSGADTVHHRSTAGSRSGSGLKRSRSISRGEDFIDCTSLETVVNTSAEPLTFDPESSSKRQKFLRPFASLEANRTVIPTIQVQHEVAVTSQGRKKSQDSGGSQTPMLPRPVHSVYNGRS